MRIRLKRKNDDEDFDNRRGFAAPDARILVVDDTEANLVVSMKLLRRTGVSLDTAKSGEAALQKTRNNSYDLIFMDHMMPEMDGIECLHRIRAQAGGKSREAKVVAFTANADDENRLLYEREGFDGYLVKPVTGKDLEQQLLSLLPKEKLKFLDEEDEPDYQLTMWGHRRLRYLKENKPGTYQMLMIKGLWNHLVSTDKRANELEDILMEQMSAAEGITEELKRKDAMLWVARRNGLKNRVREIVYNECIYV